MIECHSISLRRLIKCRTILFKSLYELGVRGATLKWFKSFLVDRTFQVRVRENYLKPVMCFWYNVRVDSWPIAIQDFL